MNTIGIMEQIKEWETDGGVQVFRAMGVAEGCRVLDFGFGAGHYAIAAANAIGPSGIVYAVDCAPASVEGLRRRISEEHIANLSAIRTDGGVDIGLPDGSVDYVLLYDIIHFEGLDRQWLVAEARRVLRPGGILSILPFHMQENDVQRLVADIVAAGFGSATILPDAGLHFGLLYSVYQENNAAQFGSVDKGPIYNFTRV